MLSHRDITPDTELSQALEQVLGRAHEVLSSSVSLSSSPSAAFSTSRFPPVMAVAYSGGLDSSVLLDLAYHFSKQHGIRLLAFHIHHGLSTNADAWLGHCRETCEQRGITFEGRHITLGKTDKSGIEEAARIGRYAALGDLCRQYGVMLLLTAHHQDDQAETVLLQLLRGAGVAGLSGMDQMNIAPELLGDDQLLIARPLLSSARSVLEQYAQQRAIAYVDDESNRDTRYARNMLRQQVMPVLAASFPGFQQRLARTAGHAQSAQRLLVELAEQDLAVCQDSDALRLSQLRTLNADRMDNLLRYWFALRRLRMPATAWLKELRTQLLGAKEDAQLCVTHPDCEIHRYRDRVFLTKRRTISPEEIAPRHFIWRGEAQLAFPKFGGRLYFDEVSEGIAADWLEQQFLEIRLRSGGERLKLARNRPTRTLKHHYQAADIPSWERPWLPLVFAHEQPPIASATFVVSPVLTGQLLYAAGLGMDSRYLCSGSRQICLRWQFDGVV